MTRWPGRRKAVAMRKHHMAEARDAWAKGLATTDPVYFDMAKIHIRTAWAFSRNVWRGKPRKRP